MKPFLVDPDLTLYQGDVLEVLKTLPAESVHCVVTSPPYWGLRDYGTGSWDGGDPDCDHQKAGEPQLHVGSDGKVGRNNTNWDNRHGSFLDVCGKCGASRVDNQLGLEPTPEQYLASMVSVFREVRRVLRSDGTCWLNMGDSYYNNNGGGSETMTTGNAPAVRALGRYNKAIPHETLKQKDLCMIPARIALALQADGWWLRSQVVWSKPNPMPESVTDRPTTSHEFVYLLTKSPRYFFDQEAVREKWADHRMGASGVRHGVPEQYADAAGRGGDQGLSRFNGSPDSGRNLRSVWEIPTQPYPEAHFATYPEELVRRCILAGTSERGCCPVCGAPWVREVETSYTVTPGRGPAGVSNRPLGEDPRESYRPKQNLDRNSITLGWCPSCTDMADYRGQKPSDPVPCTVLDPFFGSGTTGLVARKHGRRTIGIELNPSYCELAARRLQQLSLLA